MEKVVLNQRLNNLAYECVVCGETFVPKHLKHLTCSEECTQEIARNRSSLETLAKVDKGNQPYCKDCGKLLTIPANIKKGFCSYECVVRNRKRPAKTRKMTLTMQRLSNSCAYCGGLIHSNFRKVTAQGIVCSDACAQLIGLGNDSSERSVHVTRAGCDMPNKHITKEQVELYHSIQGRKNKKLRSAFDAFKLPTEGQINLLCKKYQLERRAFRLNGTQLNIEVSSLARLANAYVTEDEIGILMLDPIVGWASKAPVIIKRSFIYAHMSYENKDSYERRASSVQILRRLPTVGFKGPSYYVYEVASQKSLEAMLELEGTDAAMPDMNIRFAGEMFRTKGISQNQPEKAAKFIFPRSE